jgi:hypothetical protein
MDVNALEERIKAAFEPYRLPPDALRKVPPRPRRRPRVRNLMGALAAAVVLALTVLVVLPGHVPGGADPAAAAVLHRFSSLALGSPAGSAPQPGQYVYEKTQSRDLSAFVSSGTGLSFRYWVPTEGESWIGTDGSGFAKGRVGQPTFLTPQDRAAYEAYLDSGMMGQEWSGFEWGRSQTERYRPGELIFFDFSDLPTDVEVLKGLLERREIIGGPPGDWETFNLAADTLTWGYAPPRLRAALYQVMAELPGVELIGRTRDSLGRVGIAVGYTHDDQRQEVVFDRTNGAVLEQRWVSVSGDPNPPSPDDVCSGPPGGCGATQIAIAGPPGSMSSVTTYEVYGKVVDEVGETPSR